MFKEVATLDADATTALGGKNNQTGKPNPTKAEGYYLGSRQVDSKKSKSGKAYIHFLQTPNGNLGVWGKTDLDRKITSVAPGTMVRITQTGKQATPNGDMYKFKVEVDDSNTIEVNFSETLNAGDDSSLSSDDVDATEDSPVYEDTKPASRGNSASRVQELLNGNRK